MCRTSGFCLLMLVALGCSKAKDEATAEEKQIAAADPKQVKEAKPEPNAQEQPPSAKPKPEEEINPEPPPKPVSNETANEEQGPFADVPTIIRLYMRNGNEDTEVRGKRVRLTGTVKLKGTVSGPKIFFEKLTAHGGEVNVSCKMKREADLEKVKIGERCTIVGTCAVVVNDPTGPPYWEVLLDECALISVSK